MIAVEFSSRDIVRIPGVHPRSELIRALAARGMCTLKANAQRIYRDRANGTTVHTGYIINNHWYELFVPIAKEVDS